MWQRQTQKPWLREWALLDPKGKPQIFMELIERGLERVK